ncbi:MAG: hypothetical protein LBS86_03635 [Treponema sp.]|nr:hypothetical protein [Treponema sp.]
MAKGEKGKAACLIGLAVCSLLSSINNALWAQSDAPVSGRTLISTQPAVKPDWIDVIPKSDAEIFFVGVSRGFSGAAEARSDARENAFNQVVKFYGDFIQNTATEKTSTSGSVGETLSGFLQGESEITSFAQAVVSQVSADQYYTEMYLTADNKEQYVVYALCQIPRERALRDIENFAKNTSERYVNLLDTQNTLHATLRSYSEIRAALDKNPLHRSVAYYKTPDGQQVGLYEYLAVQMNNLASSLSFEPLASQTLHKTETRELSVRVLSSRMLSVGPLRCRVAFVDANKKTVAEQFYTLDAENGFTLELASARLEQGTYRVELELMTGLHPQVTSAFSCELAPIRAYLEWYGDALSDTDQNTLRGGLQQALQRFRVPVQMTSDVSPFSFIITLTSEETTLPIGNRKIIRGEVTVAFARNGIVLHQSEKGAITETTIGLLMNRAATFIRDNSAFYQGLAHALSE